MGISKNLPVVFAYIHRNKLWRVYMHFNDLTINNFHSNNFVAVVVFCRTIALRDVQFFLLFAYFGAIV